MAKNDNAHSVRLYESLKKNVGEEAANEIAETYPLSKAADIEKRFDWAQNVCEELTKNMMTQLLRKLEWIVPVDLKKERLVNSRSYMNLVVQ